MSVCLNNESVSRQLNALDLLFEYQFYQSTIWKSFRRAVENLKRFCWKAVSEPIEFPFSASWKVSKVWSFEFRVRVWNLCPHKLYRQTNWCRRAIDPEFHAVPSNHEHCLPWTRLAPASAENPAGGWQKDGAERRENGLFGCAKAGFRHLRGNARTFRACSASEHNRHWINQIISR